MRIRQVLLNLLSNALKFTPQGSATVHLQILAKTKDRVSVEFAVSNTGIGSTFRFTLSFPTE